MAGSTRRRDWNEAAPDGEKLTDEELSGDGPSMEEWYARRRQVHRIGDGELLPAGRRRRSQGATPEGDLSG
jgi:hypothetical protein